MQMASYDKARLENLLKVETAARTTFGCALDAQEAEASEAIEARSLLEELTAQVMQLRLMRAFGTRAAA